MFRQQTVTARDRCTGRPATRTQPVFPAESQPATATEPPGLAQRGAISLALLVFPCLRPPSCVHRPQLSSHAASGRSVAAKRREGNQTVVVVARLDSLDPPGRAQYAVASLRGRRRGPRRGRACQQRSIMRVLEVVSTTPKHALCRQRVPLSQACVKACKDPNQNQNVK